MATTPIGSIRAMVLSVTRRLHDLFGSLHGIKKRSRVHQDIFIRCRDRFREFENLRREGGPNAHASVSMLFKHRNLEDRRRAERRRQAKIIVLRMNQRDRFQARGLFTWNKMFWQSLKMIPPR